MKLTEPKWYARIALAVAASSTLPASPTTNSCPTRWGRVSRASTRATHDRAGAELAAGELAAECPLAGTPVVWLPGVAAPGEEGAPAVPAHPATAASSRLASTGGIQARRAG